jgi:hypothetical protein
MKIEPYNKNNWRNIQNVRKMSSKVILRERLKKWQESISKNGALKLLKNFMFIVILPCSNNQSLSLCYFFSFLTIINIIMCNRSIWFIFFLVFPPTYRRKLLQGVHCIVTGN